MRTHERAALAMLVIAGLLAGAFALGEPRAVVALVITAAGAVLSVLFLAPKHVLGWPVSDGTAIAAGHPATNRKRHTGAGATGAGLGLSVVAPTPRC